LEDTEVGEDPDPLQWQLQLHCPLKLHDPPFHPDESVAGTEALKDNATAGAGEDVHINVLGNKAS
jgi:hypothetical protein